MAVGSNREAVAPAEFVILAVPFAAVESITRGLGDALEGTIVIDVTNRFAPEELNGPSNAEQIQALVPGGPRGEGVQYHFRCERITTR